MSDPTLFRLRVTYVKQNRLALLSHLELARALERAVRRANLPFAVSQGFSPHMRIAFGSALPVGVGGTHEIFDVLLTNYVAPDNALVALQKASVVDLMPHSCAYVEHNAQAASVCFPYSDYEARLSCAVECLRVPESITVLRKKKEKERGRNKKNVGNRFLSIANVPYFLSQSSKIIPFLKASSLKIPIKISTISQ